MFFRGWWKLDTNGRTLIILHDVRKYEAVVGPEKMWYQLSLPRAMLCKEMGI